MPCTVWSEGSAELFHQLEMSRPAVLERRDERGREGAEYEPASFPTPHPDCFFSPEKRSYDDYGRGVCAFSETFYLRAFSFRRFPLMLFAPHFPRAVLLRGILLDTHAQNENLLYPMQQRQGVHLLYYSLS